MEPYVSFLTTTLPLGTVVVVGVAVIYSKVTDLCKRIDRLEISHAERLTWCIEHFEPKSNPERG